MAVVCSIEKQCGVKERKAHWGWGRVLAFHEPGPGLKNNNNKPRLWVLDPHGPELAWSLLHLSLWDTLLRARCCSQVSNVFKKGVSVSLLIAGTKGHIKATRGRLNSHLEAAVHHSKKPWQQEPGVSHIEPQSESREPWEPGLSFHLN